MIMLVGSIIVGYSLSRIIKDAYFKGENKIEHKIPILPKEMEDILYNNNYVDLNEWRENNDKSNN